MTVAKVFLSHHSDDKPLVEEVAHALGQRGIIPWLDKYQLATGESLLEQLRMAIEAQVAIALFLSPKAVVSDWVQYELEQALALETKQAYRDWILPIYLDEPLSLIQSCALLANTWLRPDGDTVDRIGTHVEPPSYHNRAIVAEMITDKLASSIYKLLDLHQTEAVNLVVDQRGFGWRSSDYTWPKMMESWDCPTLVFRPNMGERSIVETLAGPPWEKFRDLLSTSLSKAFLQPGTLKKVRILGDFQLGIAYHLGRRFDRTSGIDLVCYNTRPNMESVFSNEGQSRFGPLTGGDGECVAFYPHNQDRVPGQMADQAYEALTLFVGKARYQSTVQDHLRDNVVPFPLAVVDSSRYMHADKFVDSVSVMTLIQDVVAVLDRFQSHHGTRLLRLYCDLPVNVVPLLAANLTHVIDNVEFMEYRRDLQQQNRPSGDMYTHLPMTF